MKQENLAILKTNKQPIKPINKLDPGELSSALKFCLN